MGWKLVGLGVSTGEGTVPMELPQLDVAYAMPNTTAAIMAGLGLFMRSITQALAVRVLRLLTPPKYEARPQRSCHIQNTTDTPPAQAV